ncbi:MAG: redoxin domain-containing protein [Halieaceae bacterium]|nr:redoxin domain-containing protein [Halieaceae bacterium]MCP5204885.1 redoxin domain-containing protein [Pseudomonadales bacterium]
MTSTFKNAPAIIAEQWYNTHQAPDLNQLRGRMVVLEAFQMLCPGCVQHGLPQVQRIHDVFSREDVMVLGLHTVFEHHAAMTPVSLVAFLQEYKVTFPVGVDKAQGVGMPVTMSAYRMQGTPTLVLIDGQGRLRNQWLGVVPDLIVGAELMRLILERRHDNGELR